MLADVLGNLEGKRAVYVFTHNKLCLILSFLCYTVKNVTLRSMAMQQTGTVLDTGMNFSKYRVSTE